MWNRGIRCDSHLTDKGNGRLTDRQYAKNVYTVMEVVLVMVNVDAEVARSAYIVRTEQVTDKERSTNVHVTDV